MSDHKDDTEVGAGNTFVGVSIPATSTATDFKAEFQHILSTYRDVGGQRSRTHNIKMLREGMKIPPEMKSEAEGETVSRAKVFEAAVTGALKKGGETLQRIFPLYALLSQLPAAEGEEPRMAKHLRETMLAEPKGEVTITLAASEYAMLKSGIAAGRRPA